MADIQETIKQLPHIPGIYIYRDSMGNVLYVGKAVDLNRRVRQYFEGRNATGSKTAELVSRIASIETREALSEFEALLLEATLIRSWQPPFNVLAKDDKSPLYILLTISEELPRVKFVRKTALESEQHRKDAIFGPFQSARMARDVMRGIRRAIPYCTAKIRNGRNCFYTHIGLCHPCPSRIAKMPDGTERDRLVHEYRRNIFRIRDILSGKSRTVSAELEKQMHQAAAEERFEDAADTRNHLDGLMSMLKRHYDPSVYMQDISNLEAVIETEMAALCAAVSRWYPSLTHPERIECYDISNILGTDAVGSMVVLSEGRIDTKEYKKFRIRLPARPNDVAMMREVLTRRLKHAEWTTPDLIVIDGGKGQVRAASDVLTEFGLSIPVIGLAKRYEEIVIPETGGFAVVRLPTTSPAVHILQRIRDEAHRFAISYHRQLRGKRSLPG